MQGDAQFVIICLESVTAFVLAGCAIYSLVIAKAVYDSEVTERTWRRMPRLSFAVANANVSHDGALLRMATTFWNPDGKPMSAAEFIEKLFDELPELFKNEAKLRELWSRPDTRKGLLASLAARGYGGGQLAEIRLMIDATKSGLFDVLAYIAFALSPISREERVNTHRNQVHEEYDERQREFLDFVLDQYIREGVQELDDDKLPDLLELKYHAVTDAVATLGSVKQIRAVFGEFQRHLYSSGVGA